MDSFRDLPLALSKVVQVQRLRFGRPLWRSHANDVAVEGGMIIQPEAMAMFANATPIAVETMRTTRRVEIELAAHLGAHGIPVFPECALLPFGSTKGAERHEHPNRLGNDGPDNFAFRRKRHQRGQAALPKSKPHFRALTPIFGCRSAVSRRIAASAHCRRAHETPRRCWASCSRCWRSASAVGIVGIQGFEFGSGEVGITDH